MRTKIKLLIAFLCSMVIGVGIIMYDYGEPEVAGVWKDTRDSYYLVFLDDGTYTETTYNLARPYAVSGNTLTLYDINGESTNSCIEKNFGRRLRVCVNGIDRVLAKTNETPELYKRGTEPSGITVAAYKLANALDASYYLRLYPNMCYVETLGKDKTCGKYAATSTGELLLFSDTNSSVEAMKQWSRGYAFHKMQTAIEMQTLKANVIETKGVLLEGEALDTETGIQYIFDSNNYVTRKDPNGLGVKLLYFADSAGLVKMVDALGLSVEDCLYFDQESGVMYRYVMERDGWAEYLGGAGGAD